MTTLNGRLATRLARAEGPEMGNPTLIPILTPKPGASVRAILLGGHFAGFYLHWIDGRSRACIEPRDVCEGCIQKRPRRWKGYCQAYHPGSNRLAIVEATAEVARHLPILINRRESLVGREIVVERLGTSRSGPCRGRLEVRLHDTVKLGCFDLDVALCRVWGLDPELFAMKGGTSHDE